MAAAAAGDVTVVAVTDHEAGWPVRATVREPSALPEVLEAALAAAGPVLVLLDDADVGRRRESVQGRPGVAQDLSCARSGSRSATSWGADCPAGRPWRVARPAAGWSPVALPGSSRRWPGPPERRPTRSEVLHSFASTDPASTAHPVLAGRAMPPTTQENTMAVLTTDEAEQLARSLAGNIQAPVSYTHLTLPTIYSV